MNIQICIGKFGYILIIYINYFCHVRLFLAAIYSTILIESLCINELIVLRVFRNVCCDFSGSHKSKPSIQVIIGISDCIPVCQDKPDHIARPLEG